MRVSSAFLAEYRLGPPDLMQRYVIKASRLINAEASKHVAWMVEHNMLKPGQTQADAFWWVRGRIIKVLTTEGEREEGKREQRAW